MLSFRKNGEDGLNLDFLLHTHVKTFRVTTKRIEIECKIFKPKKGRNAMKDN